MSAFAAAGSALVDNNYSAIPAMPGSKIPGACLFGRWTPMSEWTRFCDRLPTDIETTAWSRWPDAGVGIVLGHGVVAFDIDTDDASIQAAILGELPELKVGKRGQKGATWFYSGTHQAAALANLSAWVPHLSLPGTLRNGAGYRAVAAWRGIKNANLSLHPTGIRDMGANQPYSPIDVVMSTFGYDFMTAALWLKERVIASYAADNDNTVLKEALKKEKWKPTARLKPGHNSDLSVVSQDMVAHRFAELYKDQLLYCHSQGAWFEWDGAIWRKNEKKLVLDLARLLTRHLSADLGPKETRSVQQSSFANGVINFAAADPVFSRTAADWDQDLWKLGTPAGVVDLHTGCLGAAKQEDMITKTTAVAPTETSKCSRWLQFLDETTGGDAELVRFLQQWCGYSLTGETGEHALVFVYGGGGNGKSVFLNTVTAILADYAATAAMDTFTATRYDKHPTDLAMVLGW
jgi:hypothetical protein